MKIASIIVLAMLSLPIHAADSKNDMTDECIGVMYNAETIMGVRQMGKPPYKAMKAVLFSDSSTRYMVIEAYKIPVYGTEEKQQKAINDFGDWIYLECIKEIEVSRF